MRSETNQATAQRAISRGMVALFKEYMGRGPTEARTYINEGLVTVLLRETLTRAERTLADKDQRDLVLELRRGFQGAFRDDAVKLVEEQTGLEVIAFMSDNSVHPDYAIEVFVVSRSPNGESANGDGAG